MHPTRRLQYLTQMCQWFRPSIPIPTSTCAQANAKHGHAPVGSEPKDLSAVVVPVEAEGKSEATSSSVTPPQHMSGSDKEYSVNASASPANSPIGAIPARLFSPSNSCAPASNKAADTPTGGSRRSSSRVKANQANGGDSVPDAASSEDAQSAVAALAMLHSSPRAGAAAGEGQAAAAAAASAAGAPRLAHSLSMGAAPTQVAGAANASTGSGNAMLVKSDGRMIELNPELLEQIRGASLAFPVPPAVIAVTAPTSWAAAVAAPRPGSNGAATAGGGAGGGSASAGAAGAAAQAPLPEGLSNADAQAIAALQELGSGAGEAGILQGQVVGGGAGTPGGRLMFSIAGGGYANGDTCDSPSQGGGSASGVNSRHGAARGRQVTRACPGCDERISIACKFCTLCGYKFRGASGKGDTSAKGEGEEVALGSARASTPRSAAHALMSPKASAGGDTMTPGHDIQTPRSSHYGGDSPLTTPRGPVTCGVDEEDAGGMPVRPTVTRVTPNSLELHKIKEQERRAREKQLLAKLQTLLFEDKEKAPSASEVTYNYVLECAVQALQDRYRRNGTPFVSIVPPMDPADVADSPLASAGGSSRGDMEKHKIKEQLRSESKFGV